MSSEAARAEVFKHDRVDTAIGLDEFFSWSEVEQRRDTMSLDEASALLGVDLERAEGMIADQSLCASRDEDTGAWLVKTACVRAQLAEAESESTESGARHLSTFNSELVDHLV